MLEYTSRIKQFQPPRLRDMRVARYKLTRLFLLLRWFLYEEMIWCHYLVLRYVKAYNIVRVCKQMQLHCLIFSSKSVHSLPWHAFPTERMINYKLIYNHIIIKTGKTIKSYRLKIDSGFIWKDCMYRARSTLLSWKDTNTHNLPRTNKYLYTIKI